MITRRRRRAPLPPQIILLLLISISLFLLLLSSFHDTIVVNAQAQATKLVVVYKAICSFDTINPEYGIDGTLRFNMNRTQATMNGDDGDDTTSGNGDEGDEEDFLGWNEVIGVISGVEPNVSYTLTVHESGDMSHLDGSSVGQPFSLVNVMQRKWSHRSNHHGNDTKIDEHEGHFHENGEENEEQYDEEGRAQLMSDGNGVIHVRLLNHNWTLIDERSIVGRSLLLRQVNSGDIYGQCVIGVRNVNNDGELISSITYSPVSVASSSVQPVQQVNGAIANRPGDSFRYASCEIRGETNQKIKGRAIFTMLNSGHVQVTARVCGLSDGYHGFHIHQYGDLSGSIDLVGSHHGVANSTVHGVPSSNSSIDELHTGDLGNIFSSNGMATFDSTFHHFSLWNETSVLGRALIIHSDKDHGAEFQPAGASGVKIAKCIIGVKNTMASLADLRSCPPLVKPKRAVCVLKPTTKAEEQNNGLVVEGELILESSTTDGSVITGTVSGLSANTAYGVHIFKYGDMNKLGEHFNPASTAHSNDVLNVNRHVGDLGNIVSDDGGIADVEINHGLWTLSGPNSVIGRTLAIDNREDDGIPYDDDTIRPLAQCVIGVENVDNNVAKADSPGSSFVYATSEIFGVGSNKIRGRITLEQQQQSSMVIVRGRICGLKTGATHGLHIHEYGDARSMPSNFGAHYNPEQNPHRLPSNPDRHIGDLPNIFYNGTGTETFEWTVDRVTLQGPNSVLGRSFVLSAQRDQGDTVQSDGGSGQLIAYGLIGTTELFIKFDDLNCTLLFPPVIEPVLGPVPWKTRLPPIIFSIIVICFAAGLVAVSMLVWKRGIQRLEATRYTRVKSPISV